MKKVTFLLFILLGVQTTFAQLGELVWEKKYGFDEGITHAFMFEPERVHEKVGPGYEGDEPGFIATCQVLITVNSNTGVIKTYAMDNKGQIGKLKAKKTLPKTGKWAVSLIKGRNEVMPGEYGGYLFISYAEYGDVEIYGINKNGSIGKKTWETQKFEKGIDVVAGMSDKILLVKPNAGWAWVFEFDIKTGVLGKILFSTKNWEKGIAAAVGTSNRSVALSHPDGKFWDISFDRDGKASYHFYTDKYHKGITTMASNTYGRDVFVCCPSVGRQWQLRIKGKNGVDVKKDIHGWEKGTTVQAYAKFLGQTDGYLFVSKPDIGRVWVFKVK